MAQENKQPERYYARDRQAWRQWLERHHATAQGIWLVYDKKREGQRTLAYNDIVEEALCFGWVDSLPRSLDEQQAMLYISPRKPKSPWSRLNKERVEKLMQQGLMAQAGLAVIEAAKRDGSWTSYDAIEAITLPPDLQQAFAANEAAAKNFAAFGVSAKKQILWYIESAKRPETRAKRIEQIVQAATQNSNPLQYSAKKKS